MNNEHIQFHNTLNQDIWDNETLKKEVRQTLLRIAEEFVTFLKVDAKVQDVLLLGSLANYNYTKYSDIDLHVVMDFSEIGEDIEFVKNYMDSKKTIWNEHHSIKIKGITVELYVQDIDEVNSSTAEYSVKSNEWLKIPSLEHPKIDYNQVLTKSKDIINQIKKTNNDLTKLNDIKEKIKHMRTSGLAEYGEYSTENLVYKALRNLGIIEKLYHRISKLYDKKLSLSEINEWKELFNVY